MSDCSFISEFTKTVANTYYEQVKKLLHKNRQYNCKKIENMKKSILYDIRKGFQDLQNNLLLNLTEQQKIDSVYATRQIIGIALPTSTLDDFKSLDSSMETKENKDALVSKISSDFLYYTG